MKSNLETLHGEVIKRASLGGLTLTESVYRANQNLPRHAHPADNFCFILEGNLTEFYHRKSLVCNPATLIFQPAGETHADEFHASARCFNIEPDVLWLGRIRQNSPVLDSPTAFRDGFVAQIVRRLYKEFCRPMNYPRS
jgi:hypothetical protein